MGSKWVNPPQSQSILTVVLRATRYKLVLFSTLTSEECAVFANREVVIYRFGRLFQSDETAPSVGW